MRRRRDRAERGRRTWSRPAPPKTDGARRTPPPAPPGIGNVGGRQSVGTLVVDLALKPDGCYVLRVPKLTREVAQRIADEWSNMAPDGARLVLVDGALELSELTDELLHAAGLQRIPRRPPPDALGPRGRW